MTLIANTKKSAKAKTLAASVAFFVLFFVVMIFFADF